jgi:hypothetical protein
MTGEEEPAGWEDYLRAVVKCRVCEVIIELEHIVSTSYKCRISASIFTLHTRYSTNEYRLLRFLRLALWYEFIDISDVLISLLIAWIQSRRLQ